MHLFHNLLHLPWKILKENCGLIEEML
jgi:hypothetical protein